MREGNLFAALYVIVMALSVVWLDKLHQSMSASFMLFIVSLSAIILYSASSVKQLKKSYQSISQFPLQWLCMSLSFALTWWLMYFTTIHASPRAAIVIFYLVVGCLGCLLDRHIFASLLCVISIILSILMLHELTLYTVISGIGCGVFGYVYMHSSGRYAELAGLSASQVLSIRFQPLFFAALLGVVIGDGALPSLTGMHVLSMAISLTLLILFNLLPNYCAQKSIMLAGTNRFSQIIAYTPAITFVVQGLFDQVWDWKILALCLTISILLNYLVVIKSKT